MFSYENAFLLISSKLLKILKTSIKCPVSFLVSKAVKSKFAILSRTDSTNHAEIILVALLYTFVLCFSIF